MTPEETAMEAARITKAIEDTRIMVAEQMKGTIRGYMWVAGGLLSTLMFVVGMFVNQTTYMPQIKVNTYRLDTVEATYRQQLDAIRTSLDRNSSKMDIIRDAISRQGTVLDQHIASTRENK